MGFINEEMVFVVVLKTDFKVCEGQQVGARIDYLKLQQFGRMWIMEYFQRLTFHAVIYSKKVVNNSGSKRAMV